MARKHRNRKPPRRTATRRSQTVPSASKDHLAAVHDPLIGGLRAALRDRDPIAFWGAAVPVVALVDDPEDLADGLPEGVDLLQMFIEVDVAETTALLHMVAALSRDEMTRARARQAARSRRQPVPPHVRGLPELTVTGTRVFSDLAGDNHLLELTLPGQTRVTLVAYVERAPRLYLKDAFFVAEPLNTIQERYLGLMAADGVRAEGAVRDLDPAQSRAALERALGGADAGPVKEPEEGDHWPMCRPLVEFALARLPEGGAGYDAHGYLVGQQDEDLLVGPDGYLEDDEDSWLDDDEDSWLDDEFVDEEVDEFFAEEIDELAGQFVASPQARGLPEQESTPMLAALLMSMAVAAEGDPMHWCEQNVWWVLTDALPRFPMLSEDALGDVTRILPALVTWAHQEVEEDAETTEKVLALTTELLADLPRRWATKEMEVGRLDAATELATLSDEPLTVDLALLVQRVGGVEELHGLGTDPLPAEPLVLDAVPEDLHGVVREIDAALVDGLAEVHADQPSGPEPVLGEEFLTACRRFLVQAAGGDPDALRGRATIGSTAAAIAWVVGRGNGLVGRPAPVRTSELLRVFGVRNTPYERAERLQEAAVLPHSPEDEPPALGSPDLLVASARQEIRDAYERLTAAAAENGWLEDDLT